MADVDPGAGEGRGGSTQLGGTQVIQRATRILKLLAANNRVGLRLVDIFRLTGLERPTVHRLLQGLVAEGLVQQDQQNKRYHLGSLLYEMGLAAAPRSALRDICHPFIRAVADQTGDTVFLTIRSGFDGVCIDREEGAFPIKAFVLEVGRRRPLNVGAGGMAILSALPEPDVENICQVNHARTLEAFPRYSLDRLRDRLAQARETGYVINDVLEVQGIRALAIPIRGPNDLPLAAISVSAMTARLHGERIEIVRTFVAAAVAAIEDALRAGSGEIAEHSAFRLSAALIESDALPLFPRRRQSRE